MNLFFATKPIIIDLKILIIKFVEIEVIKIVQ